ncbi:katanin-interacting protein-like [Gigantopelta aegis]|uniref:katanin-interacting protein-like n=1 Tax=Gigantopelta aegis TaxID=1735272 RepID=UPI001B88C5AC|nr:katanin-interacting protein-like [Gigantopelta aegis]
MHQVTGDQEGTVITKTYDWTTFLTEFFRKFPGLKSIHHFSFQHEQQGVLKYKQFIGSEEKTFYLLKKVPPHNTMPEVINPKELDDAGRHTCSKMSENSTIKERYMWVCNFSGKHSVEFVIMLQNPSPHKHFEISTIKLWNYNKSLNELDIGAKHVRIFVGGELVFDGDIEKGCGNQVFDYCSVINVSGKDRRTLSKGHHSSDMSPTNGPDSARSMSRSSQSSASSSGSHPSSARQRRRQEKGGHIRSETRTMDHSTNGNTPRPTHGSDRSESSPENQEYQDNFKMPEKERVQRLQGKQIAWLPVCMQEPQKLIPPRAQRLRLQCPKKNQTPVKSNREKADTAVSSSPSLARNSPSLARDSPLHDNQEQDDKSMMQKLKDMKQKEPQRKKDIPTWLKSVEISDNISQSRSVVSSSPDSSRTDSRGKSRMNNDLLEPSPRSDMGEELDEITPMQKIQKKRSQWKKTHENLEEEWGGLNYFNKQQKGRLSVDMEDCDFDEYLKDMETPVDPSEPDVKDDRWTDDDDEFVIPELPSGKELVINIVTTWGDRHYVGLTGVDIFSSSGEAVPVKKIIAKPLDINELPEYNKDPRVVSNIIDGVNRTRDDVHMWLAPFTPGGNHYVFMSFDKPHKIAMIRFWNYNKSRIHSYRGAKDVVVTLDGKQIFKGEIARACGGIEGGTEAFGDTILFTMDENILELVSKNDEAFEGDLFSSEEEDIERPSTADNDSDDRPFTRAAGVPQKPVPVTPRPGTSITTYAGDVLVYKARSIELNFTATWGDLHYLGLTGLEIVGKDGDALPLNMKMISAKPRDLHSLPGHEKDDRTLDKLIDGTNITNADEHMWLVPFNEGNDHTVTVSFTQQVLLSGLRVWNYNKSPEDTYRGARILHVKIDGRQVSPSEGYLVRKGTGNCHFDFAQEINFQTYQAPQNSYPVSMPGEAGLEYEVVQMPCGFIYQLQLFSTWGDQYYIGLNGLEFYDSCFNRIQLMDNNITAYPDSVNVLENVQNDVRTPDKLIDGENSTMDGRHMWLAPILPGIMNRVYVIFDQPTSISMIKVWNYSKSPARGTKDFALLVDDLLIYNGCLKMVTQGARGILPTCEGSQPYHTVLFTNNKEILKREKTTIISNQPQDQDVQLLNDKKIVTKYSDPKTAQSGKPANQALRPKTSVSVKKR